MRSCLAVVLAGALVGTGCATHTHKISSSELVRLSQLPPEARGQRVLVSQEIGDPSAITPAERVGPQTEVVIVPDVYVGGGGSWSGGGGYGRGPRYDGRPTGGGGGVGVGGKGGAPKLGSGGGDAKGAAIAVLVLAAVGLFVVAGVEGSRFDGWVQLHPMHPIHLVGRDGMQMTMPLAWVDENAARWADRAIVTPREGPWLELERKPLTRSGNYSMYGGSGSSRSATGAVEFGPSFVIQAGYFPVQQVGIVGTISFAWRDNQFGGTLFDSRYLAELQVMPLALGRFHLGGYVGAGLAYRWEDVPGATIEGDNGSRALSAGGMLQLDLHTRIALTARMGAIHAHGDRATDLLVGFSVY